MKGLENISTEMSLHVLTYNLKRVMSIIGIRPLIQAMQAYKPVFFPCGALILALHADLNILHITPSRMSAAAAEGKVKNKK
jgi:hypothetical protein